MVPEIAVHSADKRPYNCQQRSFQQTGWSVAISKRKSTAKRRPNADLFAVGLEHTKTLYAGRFHPLQTATDSGDTVLQPLAVGMTPPSNTVRGVSILVAEGGFSVLQLVLHPCGLHVLHPDVMNIIPQKGR